MDEEIFNLDLQIGEAKRKVANASVMQDTRATFAELYSEATPDEKKKLMQMHLNEVIWTPTEVKLALFETPTKTPEVVSQSLGSFSENYSLAPQ